MKQFLGSESGGVSKSINESVIIMDQVLIKMDEFRKRTHQIYILIDKCMASKMIYKVVHVS